MFEHPYFKKMHPLKFEAFKTLVKKGNVNVSIDHPIGWPALEILLEHGYEISIKKNNDLFISYTIKENT